MTSDHEMQPAQAIALARAQWARSGGPACESCHALRASHTLRLIILALQHETQRLSAAEDVVSVVEAHQRQEEEEEALQTEVEGIPSVVDPTGRLQLLGTGGFRRLRDGFASQELCTRLRAACTAAMVQTFQRGGQTTLSVVPALQDRLGSYGDPTAYATLVELLERVREVATEDLSAAQSPSCMQGGETLHHRGSLLIRLCAPKDMDEVAPASWGMEAVQPYWSPHVDQHNVREYDVSALVYLSTCRTDFDGGRFAFHDEAGDAILEPRAGQLLTFSSGAVACGPRASHAQA